MADSVNIHEAKTHFSKLLERVALGEEIIISRSGEPVAKLSPVSKHQNRTPGGAEGLELPESFFEDLPESFMKHFK